MPPLEPFLIFAEKLNSLGIPYMISGSIAAIFYGEPRFTNDVDIVVFLKDTDLPGFERAFPDEEFYRPPSEIIRLEMVRSQRAHFNLIHHETGFKADIYPCCDALHAWGLKNSRSLDLDGCQVSVAPPEYVVIRKLQFFREGGSQKHLRDIQRMHAASGDSWDLPKLDALLQEHHLASHWAQALASK